jgi:hypothetical protein
VLDHRREKIMGWPRVLMAGPLTPYSAGFVEWLVQQGYVPEVAQIHWRRMAHLSCWLQAEKTNDTVLGLASVEEFLAAQHRAGRFVRLRAGSLKPLLDYLQAAGVRVTDPPRGRITAVDTLLARYADYLTTERGLAGKTIARHVLAVREFLAARQHDGRLELERLTAGEVTAFVLEQSRQRPGSVPHLVTGLRSLLRFLHAEGLTATGLAGAVPTVTRWKLAGLPRALPPHQVAALLASWTAPTFVET